MKAIADKLRGLERKLSDEKGPFDLFALFLREDAPDVWDLVVAANWIDEAPSRAVAEISKRVRGVLGPTSITRLSRVVHVAMDNPAIGAISSAVSVEHGIAEVRSSNFFGMQIKHAFARWRRPSSAGSA
jgi:hypothetical protein